MMAQREPIKVLPTLRSERQEYILKELRRLLTDIATSERDTRSEVARLQADKMLRFGYAS